MVDDSTGRVDRSLRVFRGRRRFYIDANFRLEDRKRIWFASSGHISLGFVVSLNSNGHKAGWLVADALGFRMEQFVSLSDQVSTW